MPYKRTQNEKVTWVGQIQVNGVRTKRTFTTKRDAAKWEKQAKRLLEDSGKESATPTDSLHDWATKYLDYAQRYVPQVRLEKRSEFKRFFKHPGIDHTKPITALTPAMALEYCQEQFKARGGYAANNKVRKNLAAAYNFGIKYRRYPAPNPFLMVERFPQDEVKGHYVPPEADFLKVYAVASPHDKLLLTTLLHTAARRSEVFRLRWEDVDFDSQQIALKTRKTRDGSMRTDWIPMTDELARLLKEHKATAVGEHVFTQPNNGEAGKAYKNNRHFPGKLCERAKVKPFGCHGIRGLSATMLARAGEPMKAIQEILRHGMLATTERYLRNSGLARNALKTFEGKLPQAV
jgi:integrase